MTSDQTRGFQPPAIRNAAYQDSLDMNRSDIFFSAVQTTRMPMIITDPHQPDNPIIFANRAFIEMTGYALDELVGRNCRFLQGPETNRDAIAEVREAIHEHRDAAVEVLNYRKDGSSFWNALFVSPVFNEKGELVYFFGSQLDVSRRRDAEDSLRQAQKMEALGQLTGGIAHDFNNLLQVMSGYLEVILSASGEESSGSPLIHRAATNAHAAAGKAATLTQQLLAFSRRQKLEGRTLNLNGLVSSMVEMAGKTLGGDVALKTDLAEGLWNCKVDPTQAEVALLNLLINARDALQGREDRQVTLTTKNVDVSESSPTHYDQLPPGRFVMVCVTDNGHGMSQEVQGRVLDPFFTTKEEGKGTGLGLSMVYGFAKQSGGTVRIHSKEDQGTRVCLYFPATDDVASRVAPSKRVMDQGGSERVLIVEDREDVAALVEMLLGNAGYDTVTVNNGKAALAAIEEGGQFNLLFTDLIMPGGMNGVVLAREVRRRMPKIKILLATGYAEASLERTDAGGNEFDVLNKPYTTAQLLRKVRVVLNGPTGVG